MCKKICLSIFLISVLLSLTAASNLNRVEAVPVASADVPSAAPPSQAAPAWPMFMGDVYSTGRSPNAANLTGAIAWSYPVGNTGNGGVAIDAEGRIYFGIYSSGSCGTTTGKFMALNPDGTLLWETPIMDHAFSNSSPAIGLDGTIYVSNRIGELVAFDPDDGTELWRHAPGETNSLVATCTSYGHMTITVGPDGTIYYSGNTKSLFAVNPDGTQKWKFSTSHYIAGSPAIDPGGEALYFSSSQGSLTYALAVADGTELWQYSTGGVNSGGPSLDPEAETLYVGSSSNGNLTALNLDGTLKWQFKVGNRIGYTPAIAPDGTIITASSDWDAANHIYRLDPEDGSIIWEIATGSTNGSQNWFAGGGPAIDANDIVYLADSNFGRVRAYRLEDGSLVWNYFFNMINGIRCDLAIDPFGRLVIKSFQDQKIHVFGHTDILGPVASNVLVDPNPVEYGTAVDLTATIDDSGTGNSNIASAEYSLDGGNTWVAMTGTFNSPTVDVSAEIGLTLAPQEIDILVRGSDAYGNVGLPASVHLVVEKGTQVITFTSAAPTNAVVDGQTYTPTATGGASGNPVTISIDETASGVCEINAGVVAFIGAGDCVINANQAGDNNYHAAPQAQQSLNVGKGAQAIVFTSAPPENAVIGGPSYTPVATGGASGNPVVFTIDESASGVCEIDAGVVAFIGAGDCVINANQDGNENHHPASQVQQPFGVEKINQAIEFTSQAPINAVVDGLTYFPTASGGGSGNPVVITIAGTAADVCVFDAGVVSFIAAGNCVINANQDGNDAYSPATQAQQSFTVGKGSQEIEFTSTAPERAVVGGLSYTPTATGGASGKPVVFSIDDGSDGICKIDAGVVSFTAIGTCVINANQDGNYNYLPAPQAQQGMDVIMMIYLPLLIR